jgi:soluble lytic murein transglycosylase-like protein
MRYRSAIDKTWTLYYWRGDGKSRVMGQLTRARCRRQRRGFKIKPIAAALVVAAMGLFPGERAAARPPVEKPSVAEMLCSIVLTEARRQGLPETFFTRLIWKESVFDPKAVSPKGAQGIAQFMPGTARDRGLADPFLAGQALAASAHFLSELRATFGNLGLAAAAYNAGPIGYGIGFSASPSFR